MTVYLVMFLPNIPYIHRVYIYRVLANPNHLTELAPHSQKEVSVTSIAFNHLTEITSHSEKGRQLLHESITSQVWLLITKVPR
jgi:hypothetical protein